MEAVFRGYEIKNRKGLNHWHSLLEEWMLTIERYCRIMDGGDAPYFYNERANIGLLAGSAWRCGWIALEEFQSLKGYRNQKKTNGRIDLWLATEKEEELVEAKYNLLSLNAKDMEKQVVNTMLEAQNDAKRSGGVYPKLNAIAVGFFPVYVTIDRTDDIDEVIEDALEAFQGYDYHAIAWSFPKETRDMECEGNRYIPGIVMMVKNTKHC